MKNILNKIPTRRACTIKDKILPPKSQDELKKENEWERIQKKADENSAQRENNNLMQIIRILAKDPTLTMQSMNSDQFRHR